MACWQPPNGFRLAPERRQKQRVRYCLSGRTTIYARQRVQPLAHAIALALAIGTALPAAAQDVELGNLGTRGFRIDGIDRFDYSGRSVSGAGDVNGDGLADLIVGAWNAASGGESYVVFGKSEPWHVDLGTLGSQGFRIENIDEFESLGFSVSGAGDVNGDGLDDLIVGAHEANPGGNISAGESYVIFGKPDSATINLAKLGANGFRIDGSVAGDFSGRSVSGAGDVNGDGLADLIVGAFRADPDSGGNAGESYVVFGKTDSSPVNLGALGADGFRIDGSDVSDSSGYSVSGAGDVNGDGLADLIIGAYGADPGDDSNVGESYVVFGKADLTTVNLGTLGAQGFQIIGINANDYSGFSVSGAGDVNGDGLADLIIGAHAADPGGNSSAGESYVAFGKADATPVDLANLGSGGFRIDGIGQNDNSGLSVSGAGDVNGDGLADLIVGAPSADPGGASNVGQSYVVFGKADAASVDLGALGARGFHIDGVDVNDFSGRSVSGAGDVNGDGLADLIVGADWAESGEESNTGESYVVFSASKPIPSVTARAHSRNGNSPRVAFGISGDGSNDGSPDARAWIDFADGDDPVALASMETVTLNRSAGAFPGSRAAVHWHLQTTRQSWTSAELRLRYLDSELTSGEQTLQVYFSSTGSAPFTGLPSISNPLNNTISTTITQPGYYFVGSAPDLIFADDFE